MRQFLLKEVETAMTVRRMVVLAPEVEVETKPFQEIPALVIGVLL